MSSPNHDPDPDGREVADALYGGLSETDAEREDPPFKGRAYYGCDLDEDGQCRRAGTEHCDFNCPHPSK